MKLFINFSFHFKWFDAWFGMKKEILKAYENLEFLNSHDARPIRVLCELIESSVRLEKEKISNTLVFLDLPDPSPSMIRLKSLKNYILVIRMKNPGIKKLKKV